MPETANNSPCFFDISMPALFWFNPENDIALARGCRRFTPPRQAALLARYGAPLMWWLGREDDCVLVPELSDRLSAWEREVTAAAGRGPRLVDAVGDGCITSAMPWGWSAYAAFRLAQAGVPPEVLGEWEPKIERLRMLSHRRSASEINRRLGQMIDFGAFGMPAPVVADEAFSVDESARLMGCSGGFYLKSPWSSSGRGVVYGESGVSSRMLERAGAVIREQGSVFLEKAHSRVADFAMLFKACDDGKVRFHGYSRFFNVRGSAYAGNVVASDREILAGLEAYVGQRPLAAVRDALSEILTSLAGEVYRGFLGVDMMIAADGKDGFYLVPCVELNLRMTMGVVAHAVYRKLRRSGLMRVVPGGCPADHQFPSGVLPLVPANDHFSIVFEARNLQ